MLGKKRAFLVLLPPKQGNLHSTGYVPEFQGLEQQFYTMYINHLDLTCPSAWSRSPA